MYHSNLEEFKNYLYKLSYGSINPLFVFIPKLALLEDFGGFNENQLWECPKIVTKINKEIYRLDLIPVFDWGAWASGQGLLVDPKTNFNDLDKLTLCKLLTVIYRGDRFNSGFLKEQYENENMLKILKALELNFRS